MCALTGRHAGTALTLQLTLTLQFRHCHCTIEADVAMLANSPVRVTVSIMSAWIDISGVGWILELHSTEARLANLANA